MFFILVDNPKIYIMVDVCVSSVDISWSVDPLFCGDFMYQVKILPSPITEMAVINTTKTSRRFNGLSSANDYFNITVIASNNGGDFMNSTEVKLLKSNSEFLHVNFAN